MRRTNGSTGSTGRLGAGSPLTRRGAMAAVASLAPAAAWLGAWKAAAQPGGEVEDSAPAPPPPARALFTPEQTDVLVKALGDADAHGLGHHAYLTPDLQAALQAGDPQAQSRLRSAVFDYARAQHGGRVPVSEFLPEWGVRPASYDPRPEFAAALASDRLSEWLDGLPPPYEGYQGLKKALSHYRAIETHRPWKAIPDGPPLAQGADDPRVAALRKRLQAEDDGLDTSDEPEQFDSDLAAAVVRFQRRYGLVTDGVVGPPTLAALNVPVGGRVLQIEANMERWRWLPRQLAPSRIQVNIASAVMAVYQDDRPVLAMKAVAGRPGDETPMLTSEITSIVLNPPWHVPDSIAKKEIWPKAAKDHGYLAKNDYEVVHSDDGGTRLVQKAGPKSALGRYKFDFANPYGVYLHDTPVHSGFGRTSRLASHGCVRLEEPQRLADLLLADDPDWPPERIADTVMTEKTVRVAVPRAMPLYILYWTAFSDPSGQTAFREDAYDWDQKLIDLLHAQEDHA